MAERKRTNGETAAKHAHQAKDRVTGTPLKPGVNTGAT